MKQAEVEESLIPEAVDFVDQAAVPVNGPVPVPESDLVEAKQ